MKVTDITENIPMDPIMEKVAIGKALTDPIMGSVLIVGVVDHTVEKDEVSLVNFFY